MRDARSTSFNPEINVPPFSFFLPFFPSLSLSLVSRASSFSDHKFWKRLTVQMKGRASPKRERGVERDGGRALFSLPLLFHGWRDGEGSSQVRNATKYRIREFASSFSSSRMRGEFDEAKGMVKGERVSGNAKRDELPSLGAFSFHLVSSSPTIVMQFSSRDAKVFTRFSSRSFFRTYVEIVSFFPLSFSPLSLSYERRRFRV